jgi:hypothetical protein
LAGRDFNPSEGLNNVKTTDTRTISPFAWRIPRPGYWLAAFNLGPLGGFVCVVSVDEPKVKDLTPENKEMLAHTLDGLAEIFADKCDWMLTGALAIAAAIGKFYRHHHDLDIAAQKDEIPQVVKVARAAGYNLFHRMGSTKIWSKKRLTIFRRIRIEDILKCGDERVRLLHVGINGWRLARMSLLDAVDIYPFTTQDGWASSCHSPVRVPISQLKGKNYITLSGRELPVRGMAYMEQYKKYRKEEKDLLDLDMMQQAGLLS